MANIDQLTVINLDRTPERYARLVQRHPMLPFVRFPAVDGLLLDRTRCVAEGLIGVANLYSPGAIGSFASHVALWRLCVSAGAPIHVIEDDAILRNDFVAVAAAALSSLPEWDIVLWGWNFDWPMALEFGPGLGTAVVQAEQDELRTGWRTFVTSSAKPTLARLITATGTCCYSLSPRGAARLIERTIPNRSLPSSYPGNPRIVCSNTSMDIELCRHYGEMAAFVALPCLAVSLNVHAELTILAT